MGVSIYRYDANGNVIQKENTIYDYDDKNRRIKTTTPTQTIEYRYDANNNRIAKTTNNGTTTYLIDANTPFAQVITESKENGTQIHYTYGHDLITQYSDTKRYFYLTDALGSTRGLTDTNEALTDSYNYTPYGELQHHTGESNNSFLFTGEQFDAESHDYYLRARYYNPKSTRFMSRDSYDGTSANPITQNHYLYANANPLTYIDPSGYAASTAEVSAVGSVMGILSSIGSGIRMGALVSKRFAVNSIPALRKAVSKDGEGVVGLSHLSYIYIVARLYAKTIAREDDPLEMTPIQVYGSSSLPEHQAHIENAMIGLGSNRRPTPAVLTRVGSKDNDRNFLGRKTVCGGYPRLDGQHCDEYPYNSTLEGGTENFNLGNVSVRLVSGHESRMQGKFILKSYTRSPINVGDKFVVIPIGSTSGYFDKRGLWHEFQ